MKRNKYICAPLMLCCLLFAGCDKYLDITPKGKKLLLTVSDYDQWLSATDLSMGLGPTYCYMAFLGDNVDLPNTAIPPVALTDFVYTWQPQFSLNLSESPLFWGEEYARINLFNTVLVGIDNATGGTTSQKKALRAEALLGRALEYFYLVNQYGKPYDSTTAGTDLAVPFVTSNDVTQIVPTRSTVAEVHQRILSDLNEAIPDLPYDNSANKFRGSKAAAYSVMARIYLYARNYTDARKYAELALSESKAVMIDYNGTLPSSNLLSIFPDAIYSRMTLGNAYPTLEFMRSYASNDLRVRKQYYSTDNFTYVNRAATVYFPAQVTNALYWMNTGTSVPEMKLIVAECAARSNDLAVALQQLHEVRVNRFATASYTRFQSDSRDNVFKEVLSERIHEFPFNGLRWFDMRRFDKENRMDTVKRFNAQGTATIATLPPHSPRYTFQIPVQAITYNPDMQQNP